MADTAIRPTPILFLGPPGSSPGEEMLAGGYRAIARDVLERAREAGLAPGIVATSQGSVAREMSDLARVELDSGGFHFGARLGEIVSRFRLRRPVYLGRGYAALLPSLTLKDIGRALVRSSRTVITNNYYSSDLIAFTPGQAIQAIQPPAQDNPLAQLLERQAGLRVVTLPRSAATLFDVDSPVDLQVLRLHPGAGPRARAYLQGLGLDLGRLARFLRLLSDPNAEVVVAGRVSSFVWSQMETRTACRVRVLAEERGMRADGREEAGTARSILGLHLGQVGPRHFFRDLAHLGQGAALDTRVLFAHLGLRPIPADRFHSDLGWPQLIQDPFLREFTDAALESPIPVLLGGHSLVSGGLLALLDVLEQGPLAWPEPGH